MTEKTRRCKMKYIAMGIAGMLLFAGCVGQPRPLPQPKPVEKKVEKPKPKPKPKKRVKKYNKKDVPPLPEREVDMDLDNVVDQAAAEVLNDDNVAQEMPK
jgi:PBP1b-binding outer membrane lipoprotein LpoB